MIFDRLAWIDYEGARLLQKSSNIFAEALQERLFVEIDNENWPEVERIVKALTQDKPRPEQHQ